jgi:hypothetical protein
MVGSQALTLPGNGKGEGLARLMSYLAGEIMKFRVLFVANGSIIVDADSQAEAEEKSENLSDAQVAGAIDSVEILDVVREGKQSGRGR